MQDRYAGDLGDYLKFGLLGWLVPPDSPCSLRLGVVWYRTLDEGHNADGKHVAYLQPGHRSSARLRPLDPDLYQRLARVVASERRSTAALAEAGILGPRTCFFGDPLDFTGLPPGQAGRAARQDRRRNWLQQALAATAGCDLIFADPGNGIRPAAHREPAHRTKAVKHAYLDELAAFAQRGQSVIVCHHADRSAAAGQQARRRLAGFAAGVPRGAGRRRARLPRHEPALPGRRRLGGPRPVPDRTAYRPPAQPAGRGTHRLPARLTPENTDSNPRNRIRRHAEHPDPVRACLIDLRS